MPGRETSEPQKAGGSRWEGIQQDKGMHEEKEELSQSERLRLGPSSACCGQGAEGAMPSDWKPHPWPREGFNTRSSQLQMPKRDFHCYFIANSKDYSFSWDGICNSSSGKTHKSGFHSQIKHYSRQVHGAEAILLM